MVLSVPGFFTDKERAKLLDAANLAEIKILKLMNETTATALEYGILRRTYFHQSQDMCYSLTLGILKQV